MRVVIARAALACSQNVMLDWKCATSQLFVMYHGAPGCGRFGSLMSDDVWAKRLYAQMAAMPPWIRKEMMGSQMCMMNIMPLTRRKNMLRTDITTFQLVMLYRLSVRSRCIPPSKPTPGESGVTYNELQTSGM